jgi:hypothetical protein
MSGRNAAVCAAFRRFPENKTGNLFCGISELLLR